MSKKNDSAQAANKEHNKNAVYLSLGGPAAGLYSLNYERKIGKDIWAMAGFTYGPLVSNFFLEPAVAVPLGINKLLGNESKFFEIGLGTTLYFADIDNSFNLFGDDDDDINNIAPGFNFLLTSSFNYRYQPSEGNFIFKIGLSPIFIPSTGDFFPLIGISIGGAF
ncbi:MAG: hypothetical protein JXR26_07330 [Balneolaceae bacterium]|nr:hypothetical protein [Balneolaceae bacterium]